MPGMAVRYHSVRSISRPAPIIEPQLITLASPRPRNASADSVRMAVATMIDAVTMIGAAAFGRIWRKMMRAVAHAHRRGSPARTRGGAAR